jgi:hypothetical protein
MAIERTPEDVMQLIRDFIFEEGERTLRALEARSAQLKAEIPPLLREAATKRKELEKLEPILEEITLLRTRLER